MLRPRRVEHAAAVLPAGVPQVACPLPQRTDTVPLKGKPAAPNVHGLFPVPSGGRCHCSATQQPTSASRTARQQNSAAPHVHGLRNVAAGRRPVPRARPVPLPAAAGLLLLLLLMLAAVAMPCSSRSGNRRVVMLAHRCPRRASGTVAARRQAAAAAAGSGGSPLSRAAP